MPYSQQSQSQSQHGGHGYNSQGGGFNNHSQSDAMSFLGDGAGGAGGHGGASQGVGGGYSQAAGTHPFTHSPIHPFTTMKRPRRRLGFDAFVFKPLARQKCPRPRTCKTNNLRVCLFCTLACLQSQRASLRRSRRIQERHVDDRPQLRTGFFMIKQSRIRRATRGQLTLRAGVHDERLHVSAVRGR